jgi:hypothetical protein
MNADDINIGDYLLKENEFLQKQGFYVSLHEPTTLKLKVLMFK